MKLDQNNQSNFLYQSQNPHPFHSEIWSFLIEIFYEKCKQQRSVPCVEDTNKLWITNLYTISSSSNGHSSSDAGMIIDLVDKTELDSYALIISYHTVRL